MREFELKAVVHDLASAREQIEKAGATLAYEGRLLDQRYDVESRELARRDEVLRVRRYETGASARTHLDWKGPTEMQGPYKIREEISTPVADFPALEQILAKLGFEVTMEVDRHIAQYELGGATIRFEAYPRMDVLVEVEGEPAELVDLAEGGARVRGFGGAAKGDRIRLRLPSRGEVYGWVLGVDGEDTRVVFEELQPV